MYSEVFKGRKKKTIEYYAIKSVALSQKRRVHQEVPILPSISYLAWRFCAIVIQRRLCCSGQDDSRPGAREHSSFSQLVCDNVLAICQFVCCVVTLRRETSATYVNNCAPDAAGAGTRRITISG